jgi:hypothetical protein
MTKIPEGYEIKPMWDDGTLIINKRGDIIVFCGETGMYQGLTATMDTTEHKHIVAYITRDMKREGLLRPGEKMRGSVLIDDGTICIVLDPSRTHEECQEVIGQIYDRIIKVYAQLGFKIDKVKALWSCIKFTFLNRLYLGGSEVPRAGKVFAKADRELTRNYPSIAAQVGSVFGSYSAALKKGGDPLVCYRMAMWRSIDLVVQTNGRTMNYKIEIWFAILFAPESLGGFNFPTYTEFCGPANPDRLSTYLGLMKSAVELLGDSVAARSLGSKVQAMIGREMRVPVARSLANGARSISFKGVVSPAGLAKAALVRALPKFGLSPMFKEALDLYTDSKYWDALNGLLTSCSWDLSFLEKLLEVSPHTIISEMVERAFKNELHGMIIPYRERHKLARDVRIANKKFALASFALEPADDYDNEVFLAETHFQAAERLRRHYYESGGFVIRNHTLPDPIQMFCHNPGRPTSSLAVHSVMPDAPMQDKGNSTWGSTRESYRNLYDGHTGANVWKGMRSAGMIDTREPVFSRSDPIRKKAILGSVLASFVDLKGGSGEDAWRIMAAMWGETADSDWQRLRLCSGEVGSTKRLGAEMTVRHHTILAYPSAIECSYVDAEAIGRVLDRESYHISYPSIVAAWKTHTLLETGLHNSPIARRVYDLRPGCLMPSDPAVFNVEDRASAETALALLRSLAPCGFSGSFRSSLRDYEMPEGNGYVGHEDVVIAPRRLRRAELSRGVIDPGMATAFLRAGAIAILAMPSRKRGRGGLSDAGEDFDIAPSLLAKPGNAHRNFLTRIGGPAFATLSLAAAYVRQHLKAKLPDLFYTASWSEADLAAIAENCVKQMGHVASRVDAMIGDPRNLAGYLSSVNTSLARAITGTRSRYQRNLTVGLLALWSMGRLITPEAYKAVNSNDHTMARICYSYAQKRQWIFHLRAKASAHWQASAASAVKSAAYAMARDLVGIPTTARSALQELSERLSVALSRIALHAVETVEVGESSDPLPDQVRSLAESYSSKLATSGSHTTARGLDAATSTLVQVFGDLFSPRVKATQFDDSLIMPSDAVTAQSGDLEEQLSYLSVIDMSQIPSAEPSGALFGSLESRATLSDLERHACYAYEFHGIAAGRGVLSGSRQYEVPAGYSIEQDIAVEMLEELRCEDEDGGADEEAPVLGKK